MFQGSLPAVSNREDFELFFQLVDDDTSEPIDLTSADIVFELRDSERCLRISGAVSLVEDMTSRVFIGRENMTTLCSGSYEIGMTVRNSDITRSYIIGSLPVLNGVVQK